jgi:4-hydroxy-3-methylbut-2-en-1-yl diphosphate reductase
MKQFNIPFTYRSNLITAIKENRKNADKLKKDFTPTLLDLGNVEIYLARHFGFCYGVENAIEIAFKTIDENPGKRIYLLSEMIHNPQVNDDLLNKGIKFLFDTKGNVLIPFENLTSNDIIIIPAFGTTLAMEQKITNLGISTKKYNTTCPFVEKVWNRGEQIAKKNYSIVVHGKPTHEETRATFSHAANSTPTVIVNDMTEAITLSKYITGEKLAADFYAEFEGRYSKGFNVEKDLERIGVINQTTMLASDTQGIADFLKNVMVVKYDLTNENVGERFADTRDTLCYATNDNQSAVYGLLQQNADLAIVVGGYNSSNTSHLVELCEEKLPTYFINNDEKIILDNNVIHYDLHNQIEIKKALFLDINKKQRILVTSGASCPDAIVEKVIRKIAILRNCETQLNEIIKNFTNN